MCKDVLPSDDALNDMFEGCDYSDIRHHKCYDLFWRYKEEYPILFYAYDYFCHIDFKTEKVNTEVSQ